MPVTLYDHQVKAVDKLRNGNILVGGVGSGKSITSLAYYYTKVCGGKLMYNGLAPMTEPRDLYIITTALKRDNREWEMECNNFLLDKEHVTIDSWNNIKKYVGVKDAFFIFDEQRLVGSGVWVQSFYKIARENQWILLSATPGDTWTDYIPVFVANGFYKNKTQFENRHCVYNPYVKFKQVKKYLEEGVLQRYRRAITVDMPFERHTVQKHEVVYTPFDKTVYTLLMKYRWNGYEDRPVKNISELCVLLRQVSALDKSRVEACEKLLRMHGKAIIFYNYNKELELLREMLERIGFEYGEWNGHSHTPLPSGERWAYLVQYNAGAEGWNCTSADTLIFYSEPYSYKKLVQAAGRIDRMNTPYTNLYYYHLRSQSPIDRAVAMTLKRKKTFNETKFIGEGVMKVDQEERREKQEDGSST